jgi:Zn-dependent alcohol dehydrogenase
LAIVEVAKIFDIKNIVIVDVNEEKLLYASKLGAKTTVKFTSKAETLHVLEKIYSSHLPTIAIDTTGNIDAIEICYEVSAPNARVILVGVPKVGTKASIYTLPLHFDKILKGSHGGGSKPEIDIPILLDLIHRNELNFESYPTQNLRLKEINEALTKLRSGATAGRLVIDFQLG